MQRERKVLRIMARSGAILQIKFIKRLLYGKNIHVNFFPIPIKRCLIYVIVSEKENKHKTKGKLVYDGQGIAVKAF